MLTQIQLRTMLTLQNQMNCTVDENWIQLNRNWMLAAAMEASEAIGHHGWKWWKKQTPDIPQLQMELVDIWHFALSKYIANGFSAESISDLIESTPLPVDDSSLLYKLQLLMALCSADNFNIILFIDICEDAGLSSDDLYKQYVGKNILNIFRQDNGYKDDSYIKIWQGEEDNVHLTRIIDSLDIDSVCFADDLMNELSVTYTALN